MKIIKLKNSRQLWEDMRSQISWKTNDKKLTNEIISRHLASNLHIGRSCDLTTAFVFYFVQLN